MKKHIITIVLLSIICLISCKSDKTKPDNLITTEEQLIEDNSIQKIDELEDILTLIIADHLQDCIGVTKGKCLLVKENDDDEWQLMYQNIENFEYEEGFEYKLEVKREEIPNPPADHSSIKYILIRVISKTKK
jgi:hypothetical protein